MTPTKVSYITPCLATGRPPPSLAQSYSISLLPFQGPSPHRVICPLKAPQASIPLVTQPLSMSVGPFTHSWLYHYYAKPVPLSGFRVSTDRSHQCPHYTSVHSNPAIIAHTKLSYYKCLSFPRLPCCLLPFSFSENLPLEMNQKWEAHPLATYAGSR